MKKREITLMMALVSVLVFFIAANAPAHMGSGMMGHGMMGGSGMMGGGGYPKAGIALIAGSIRAPAATAWAAG